MSVRRPDRTLLMMVAGIVLASIGVGALLYVYAFASMGPVHTESGRIEYIASRMLEFPSPGVLTLAGATLFAGGVTALILAGFRAIKRAGTSGETNDGELQNPYRS